VFCLSSQSGEAPTGDASPEAVAAAAAKRVEGGKDRGVEGGGTERGAGPMYGRDPTPVPREATPHVGKQTGGPSG
jgi:hypothetical protein